MSSERLKKATLGPSSRKMSFTRPPLQISDDQRVFKASRMYTYNHMIFQIAVIFLLFPHVWVFGIHLIFNRYYISSAYAYFSYVLKTDTYIHSAFGEYTSPKLQKTSSLRESDVIASEKRYPVFIGPNGTFFDIYYLPLDNSTLSNGTTSPELSPSSSTNNLHQSINTAEIANSFPSPEQFESYFDYEQALLDWKMTVEGELNGLRLPNVMGRKFFRPKVVELREVRPSKRSLNELIVVSDTSGRRST